MLSRLRNVLLLLLSFVAYPFLGKANRRVGAPKTVLIVQLAKLGDMVCTTPMFRAAKNKYPDCKVVVVGLQSNTDLLRGNSDVDEYIVYDGSLIHLWRQMNKRNFDFACMTTPNSSILALMYLLKIPLIAAPTIVNGYSPYETKPYKLLRNFVNVIPHSMGSYAPREYLRLLESINIFTEDTSKHLVFSKEAERRTDEFLKENNIFEDDVVVTITPGAGNKIKQWPSARFSVLADYLITKYKAKILVIGGPKDTEEAQDMLKNMNNKSAVFNTAGKFSVDELKALISKTDLLIGVDTGPIYIAEAFGVPTVDIIGPMDENEQPPRGGSNMVVVADRKAPVMHIMNARHLDEVEARRQVEAVTTQMVIEAVDVVLPKLRFI